MSIREHIPDDIKRASKVIGLAIWLEDPDAWLNATAVIQARLSPSQRKALAYAALYGLPEDHFNDVMACVFGPEQRGAAA